VGKLTVIERRPKAPVQYTPELADEICAVMSEASVSVAKLCRANPHWPSWQTIYQWRHDHAEFHKAYELARQQQGEMLAYEILEIGDDDSGDTKIITNNAGKEVAVMDREYVQRSQIRCENRKWLAAHVCPAMFGNKLDLNARTGFQRHEDYLDQLD
jgi:hypothetical protein